MKELISWLSAYAVLLYAVLLVFPYGVWGKDAEFDFYGS